VTPTNSSHRLWDFAWRTYSAPGIEPLCLTLQDEWQAEVGLLLWLRWLETRGQLLSASQLHLAQSQIAPWQNRVLNPLRELRRQIKADYPQRDETTEACRPLIQSAERRAEQQTLEQLAALSDSWFGNSRPEPLAPGRNLRLYTDQLELPEALHQKVVQGLGSSD